MFTTFGYKVEVGPDLGPDPPEGGYICVCEAATLGADPLGVGRSEVGPTAGGTSLEFIEK